TSTASSATWSRAWTWWTRSRPSRRDGRATTTTCLRRTWSSNRCGAPDLPSPLGGEGAGVRGPPRGRCGMPSIRAASVALVAASVWLSTSWADAPPAVNPAAAHADGVVNGLDGPGLALACQSDGGLVVVGCEHGALHYWRKDVVMGVRFGDTA